MQVHKGARMFDGYAFADYSGARSKAEQRKHIALAVDEGAVDGMRLVEGITRRKLLETVMELLREAHGAGKRMILGFDHNYGFPEGFHEAVRGETPTDWRTVVEGYVGAVVESEGGRGIAGRTPGEGYDAECRQDVGDAGGLLSLLENWAPREWAAWVNERVGAALGTSEGPFWGTMFKRRPDMELFRAYRLPDGGASFRFRERRLVEERFRRLKPAYQLGGIGSVGQQSLYGILYLRELLRRCEREEIPMHVWPQDGEAIPNGSHVLAEMYPTWFLEPDAGPRSDAGDAMACVRWLSDMDRQGELAPWFTLRGLTEEERERARLEGWALGMQTNID